MKKSTRAIYVDSVHGSALSVKPTKNPQQSSKMSSLSLKPRICLHPNPSTLHFVPLNRLHTIQFLHKPKSKTKIACSATEHQPQQQKQSKDTKKKKPSSEEDKGIDPVGFLGKLDISHKAFAQFLRERYFLWLIIVG